MYIQNVPEGVGQILGTVSGHQIKLKFLSSKLFPDLTWFSCHFLIFKNIVNQEWIVVFKLDYGEHYPKIYTK